MKLKFHLTNGEGEKVGSVYTAKGERQVIKLDPSALDSFDGWLNLKRPENDGADVRLAPETSALLLTRAALQAGFARRIRGEVKV